ncbi:MAG: peptidylprolyl isomerase [Armatimonadota bacterium]
MPTPQSGEEVAVLETNHGRIVLGFLPEIAPKHVDAFKKLVRRGFYDETRFHRVIPGFMIQGGDPNSDPRRKAGPVGTGGPGYSVPAEFSNTPHERGILSAARSADPNSAGSQFFLMHKKSPHLDGQYSVYGYTIQGLDVIDAIAALPRGANDAPKEPAIIESARLEVWPLQGEAAVEVL